MNLAEAAAVGATVILVGLMVAALVDRDPDFKMAPRIVLIGICSGLIAFLWALAL